MIVPSPDYRGLAEAILKLGRKRLRRFNHSTAAQISKGTKAEVASDSFSTCSPELQHFVIIVPSIPTASQTCTTLPTISSFQFLYSLPPIPPLANSLYSTSGIRTRNTSDINCPSRLLPLLHSTHNDSTGDSIFSARVERAVSSPPWPLPK